MKQIVIEIDDDYFELLIHDVERGNDYKPFKIIANKHHGRLIDAVFERLRKLEKGIRGR